MLDEDIKRLEQPYKEAAPDGSLERLADSLGVGCPALRSLNNEIGTDFDRVVYGIRWWANYPKLGAKRRIIISDYLVIALQSIEQNLIEAKLHLMELHDLWNRADKSMEDAVSIDPVHGPQFRHPENKTPLADALHHLINMHTAGFLRAVASSIDCLGAVLVGVMALERNLRKTGFMDARRVLKEITDLTKPGAQFQSDIHQSLEQHITKCGPTGWLEWTLTLRNMLVHRARRIELVQLRPVALPVLDAHGFPIVKTEFLIQLPSKPNLSDIEALVNSSGPLVLEEDARTTLEGILQSTIALMQEVGRELETMWIMRRRQPDILVQPRTQWPHVEIGAKVEFQGYNPGSLKFEFSAIAANPGLANRMLRSSLLGQSIKNWSSFD